MLGGSCAPGDSMRQGKAQADSGFVQPEVNLRHAPALDGMAFDCGGPKSPTAHCEFGRFTESPVSRSQKIRADNLSVDVHSEHHRGHSENAKSPEIGGVDGRCLLKHDGKLCHLREFIHVRRKGRGQSFDRNYRQCRFRCACTAQAGKSNECHDDQCSSHCERMRCAMRRLETKHPSCISGRRGVLSALRSCPNPPQLATVASHLIPSK
jgi:hypothetical protein